jgi:Na+/H+ antiporter NhaD/arsenite permease-like protein
MNVSLLILVAVFVVIAARKIGRVPVKIWHAMTAGAVLVLVTRQISPHGAMQAIDLDVMVFLFGMFVVGEALILSGYLSALASGILHRLKSADGLVLTLLFGAGLTSAVLMNDTLAIVGTPLVLRLAREHRLEPRLLLMTLAVAVTTGSVLSPIGNPQT